MIYLYSGTPGSGKSLHTAHDIVSKLRRKHRVIANFPIDLDVVKKGLFLNYNIGIFKYFDNSELTVEALIDFAKNNHVMGKEGQTLLIIDECQVIFNAREFNSKDRMKWIKFFTQHRKLGYNVILIAQNDRMIDRQIRALVEYEIRHRKANSFGTIGMLIPVPLFASVTYWYGVKERIGVEFFIYSKKYSKLYDSYMMFDTVLSATGEVSTCGGDPVAVQSVKNTNIDFKVALQNLKQ